MSRHLSILSLSATLLVGACDTYRPSTSDTARGGVGAKAIADTAPLTPAVLAVFTPLPAQVVVGGQPPSDAQVALGRALYYETLLSDGHDVSCNSCHPLNGWGADGRKVSLGHDGKAGTRNAPTVYNAAGHLAQFWDGRAADVEAQAKGPILNPVEMAMPDSAAVLSHMRESRSYVAAFRAAFPGEAAPITYDNVGRAIGAFERRLLTPSRWDRYLTGDSAALTVAERQGLQTFLAAGCQGCHNGAYVGGGMYQKAGLVNPWFSQSDSGRYQVTRADADRFVFKVPSLRNIAKTGPYFHDGSVASLDEAVRLMAHHQLGVKLTPAQVTSIVTWLSALTGDIPTAYIAFPQQPK